MCLPHITQIVAFFIFHFGVKRCVGVMSSDKTTYDNMYNVITDDSTLFCLCLGLTSTPWLVLMM